MSDSIKNAATAKDAREYVLGLTDVNPGLYGIKDINALYELLESYASSRLSGVAMRAAKHYCNTCDAIRGDDSDGAKDLRRNSYIEMCAALENAML